MTKRHVNAIAGRLSLRPPRCYRRDIARFIHAQMQEHYWEDVAGYEVQVKKGYTELKQSAYAYSA